MSSFFRVAWRDSQSHCHVDHDTREQAEAHVDRLKRTKLSSGAFCYEVPLIQDDRIEEPVPIPTPKPSIIEKAVRRVLGETA